MATFMVNGKEKELRYNFGGIDISNDFIGNTNHGMKIDNEGCFVADQDDFNWWQDIIKLHENMDKVIDDYKYNFGRAQVSEVVEDTATGDYEQDPGIITNALIEVFGLI